MTNYYRESKIDPHILLAQEGVRKLALDIYRLGELVDDRSILTYPPQSSLHLKNEIAKIGLQEFIDVSDNPFIPENASRCSVELFGSHSEFPMYVEDLVNGNDSYSHVMIPEQSSWCSKIGFTVPHVGKYDDGDSYSVDHIVTLIADSTDHLPTMSSVLEIEVDGLMPTDETITLRRDTPLSPEQTIAFSDLVCSFINRKDRVL